MKETHGKTAREILDEMTPQQKTAVYLLVGEAIIATEKRLNKVGEFAYLINEDGAYVGWGTA